MSQTSNSSPTMFATIWSKLQLDTSDPTFARGNQVQIHDPLWFLARQWQVGEFTGFDGGSPVNAAYQLQQARLTAYQPAPTAVPTPPVEPIGANDPPLEVRVEREPFPLGLRGSVQLGLRFEAIVRDTLTTGGQASQINSAITQFRAAFPIPAAIPTSEITDPKSQAFRRVVAGRLTDGYLLYQTATGVATGVTMPATFPTAVSAFVAYCQSLYTLPPDTAAWENSELAYELNAGIEISSPGTNVGLTAPNFPGGQLDWYSFDYTSPAIAAGTPQTLTPLNDIVIPHRLSVPGMPGSKFWEFEDGQINLGDLETQVVDLTKMLLSDFAAVANNNWYQFSILTPLGTLNRLAVLRVTDTFGAQTLIPPTADLDPPAGTGKSWQMFTLAGDATRRDTLLFPPTLGRVIDGPALEDVLFLRDDMAAMAWAVEQSLDGPLDTSVSGFESQLEPPPPVPTLPAGADVNYLVGTTVPRNWIPLLPFVARATDPNLQPGSLMLRRGAMFDPTATSSPPVVQPRGVVLTPGSMFVTNDQAVTRSGVRVERYVRRARWIDGSTYCWMARRVGPGKGQGNSGLAFDKLETPAPAS